MAREYKGRFLGFLIRPRLVNSILTRDMVKGKIFIVDRIEMKVYLLRGRTKSASMLDVSFFFKSCIFFLLAALGLHYELGFL